MQRNSRAAARAAVVAAASNPNCLAAALIRNPQGNPLAATLQPYPPSP